MVFIIATPASFADSPPQKEPQRIIAWDIHGVLCTKTGFGKRGYKCDLKSDSINLIKELFNKNVSQVIWSNISCSSFKKLQKKFLDIFGPNSQYFLLNRSMIKGKYSKPKTGYFLCGIQRAKTIAANITFFDDKLKHVLRARKLKIDAHHFHNAQQARNVLVQKGFLQL